MKIPNFPLSQRILNLPEGTISGLLGTLVAVLIIIACAVPAVGADDNATPTEVPTTVPTTAATTVATTVPTTVPTTAVPTPVADFTWSASPVTGKVVSFIDESTGTGIDNWSWDFDDTMDFTGNRYSEEQNPSHTYNYVDNYMVTLTVWNDGGSNIVLKQVTVGAPTPTTPVPQTTAPTATPTPATVAQTAAPTATPAPDAEGGFVDEEYRKMTGLYNEYIRIIFGFLGIDDEPDFLIIAVNSSQT